MQIRDSSDLFILFCQSRASVFAFATMPSSRILLTLRPLRIPFPGVRVVRRQRNSALSLLSLFFLHLLFLHFVYSCFQHRWSRRCVGICHVGEKPQREQTQVSLIVHLLCTMYMIFLSTAYSCYFIPISACVLCWGWVCESEQDKTNPYVHCILRYF